MKGSAIVLQSDGKVLLQLRDNIESIPHPNKWGLFGGTLEEGESHLQTIIREIKEELEINLEELHLEFIAKKETETHTFHVFKYLKEIDIATIKLNEGQDAKLFTKEEIAMLENRVPGLKKFVEEFL
ncbi:MAG: NUDIX domain-containing protein [archaeon]